MGVFKLGTMTLGSIFKKPETVMYPVEVKQPPAGLKGQIVCDANTCILCGLCQKACTCDCITVNKAERTWSIDHYACVQCGYCITNCAKKSLSMDPHYAAVTTQKHIEVVEVPEQEKPAKKAAAEAVPAKEGAATE